MEHVKVYLLDSNAEIQYGLNWGQREKRDPNQTYLQLEPSVYKGNFFPEKGKFFIVKTDDGKTTIFTRAQKTYGCALHTPENNAILGEYLRKRINLNSGSEITRQDILKYGKLDIDIYKTDEKLTYLLNFSKDWKSQDIEYILKQYLIVSEICLTWKETDSFIKQIKEILNRVSDVLQKPISLSDINLINHLDNVYDAIETFFLNNGQTKQLFTNFKNFLESDYFNSHFGKDIFCEINNPANNYTINNMRDKQIIFYGAPGTGKSFHIKVEVDDKKRKNFRTTFHPDSDYSTFVGAYKPTTVEEPVMTVIGTKAVQVENPDGSPRIEKKIVYSFVPQAFLKAYTEAWKNQNDPVFLIIEEINRGNCAQIFGDLFQLLDRDDETGRSVYPISPDEDIQKFLLSDKKFGFADLYDSQKADIPDEVLTGELLILPANLYIWATMNTSDQSLFPIDSAFKRRWNWHYMPISNANLGWQIEANGNRYNWWDFLEKINEKIGSTTNSEDKKLGYFFCKDKNGIIDADTFVAKVVFYVWNDVFKDFADEAGSLFKDDDGSLLSFNKFYTAGVDGNAKVNEVVVAKFLGNLGVAQAITDEGQTDNSFKLDGTTMSLREIAQNVVLNYSNRNTNLSANEIRNYFNGLGVGRVVETEEDYHKRDGQPSQERSVTKIVIPSGENLYVNTQWRAKNDNDNFLRFVEIVNNNGLGNISR